MDGLDCPHPMRTECELITQWVIWIGWLGKGVRSFADTYPDGKHYERNHHTETKGANPLS